MARPIPVEAPVTRTARPASTVAVAFVIHRSVTMIQEPAMRLLISVASATDAAAALAGGADLIDAKDVHAGALGRVAPAVLRAIRAVVGGARPVTAALGDADDEATIECAARTFAAGGA